MVLGKNRPLPLFSNKIINLPLYWKYLEIYHIFETRVCHETRVPKTQVFWKNILQICRKIFYIKNFQNFSMVLKFHELEYHEKHDFAKLKYAKSDKFLHISEIVINCNIICKNMLFDYFCQWCPHSIFGNYAQNSFPQLPWEQYELT